MRAAYWTCVVAGCLIGVAGLLVAQDLSKLTEAQRKQLNDWMAERAERMIAVHRLEGELAQAVNDTANTSPEIEALRKRCQSCKMSCRARRPTYRKRSWPCLRCKKSARSLGRSVRASKRSRIR